MIPEQPEPSGVQSPRGSDYARALAGTDLVTAIHYREVLDSTSSFLQSLAATVPGGATPCHGVVAIADRQTAGRGRHGRQWESPPGSGLLFSLLLDGHRVPSVGLLPAATGVAVVQAIRELLPELDPRLKWPNDVLLRGNKVCGILVEQSESVIVLGVGLNVFQELDELPPGVPATSLALELRHLSQSEIGPPDHPVLLEAILRHLQQLLDPQQGVTRTLRAFEACHDTLGKRVRVASPDPSRPVVEGLALAVDTDGALILRLDHGPTVAVHSGDATLRAPGVGESPPHPQGS